MRVFLGVSAHTCSYIRSYIRIRICVCTVFLKEKKLLS
jgi:hypothetical protein